MKKTLVISLALAILFAFVGCGAQPAPEAPPEEEASVNPLDAYLESVETVLQTNFPERYSLERDGETIVINVWRDGLASEAETVLAGSPQEMPEGWKTIVNSFQSLSAQIQSDLDNNGYGNIAVLTNVVSDLNHDVPLLCIRGNSVVYDLVGGAIPDSSETAEEKVEAQEALKAALSSGSVRFSRDVTDDVTGNWRLLLYSSGEDILNHAADYYKAFFENDSEVHCVVNLGLGTTTVINAFGESLYVDVHEYVDKEEHSAKTLGGGTLLKSYLVRLSTGEIEDLSA